MSLLKQAQWSVGFSLNSISGRNTIGPTNSFQATRVRPRGRSLSGRARPALGAARRRNSCAAAKARREIHPDIVRREICRQMGDSESSLKCQVTDFKAVLRGD